ncbi:MAG: hypothetical protein IPH44_01305 [Myxococcales bacterium]|nr:hypothetical protein [Myxococcales bacterium]MBK7197952.1 hypothetical protein [Myxococcales bacterium]
MRTRLIATMAVVGTLATIGVARADEEPAVAPEQAQAIGLAVTAAGLLGSAYLWQTAGGLPADDGRDERRMLAAGAATLTLGVGPMAGLWAGGARRRAVLGGATRPAMIVVGGLGAVTGALVIGFGCFETSDCRGAQVAGGALIGAGALLGAGAVAWAAWDLLATPSLVARRRGTRIGVAPVIAGDRVGLAVTVVR